jgi:hypothetical protein
MSKHAPGPWKCDHDVICCLPDGKDGDWFIIARMPGPYQIIDHRNDGFAWESNSKLIAAAPEMIEALKAAEMEIVEYLETLPKPHDCEKTLLIVRAAIAKAIGSAE